MNISGSGRLAAGEYSEEIKVSGSTKIDGSIKCTSFKCSGSTKSIGDIICNDEIRISGAAHIEKKVSASSVHVSGAFKCGECAAENEIKSSGAFRCEGNIKCTKLASSGVIYAGEGIEAEEVKISGLIECTGLLNAEKIDIEISGKGLSRRIGSIGGSEIKIYTDSPIKKPGSRLSLFSRLVRSSCLEIDESIEGDIIALENVKAPKVIGRIVAIGAGCDIENVQYSEDIEIHPDAKIGHYEKI